MNKISLAQIDPNGNCNSKCWFCPVAYVPNPSVGKKTMPIELFRSIMLQLHEGKGDFVSENFNGIYTAHYNEVLMYPHFEEMLEILREFNLGTVVLSNGTPLSKKKIDIIKKYQDVIRGVNLNIPAAEPELWSKWTGFPTTAFEPMMENIRYFHEQLPQYVKNKAFSIQMNGLNQNSLLPSGGWLDKLENAPDINLDVENGDLRRNYKLFKQMFPETQIYEMPSLVDRAGYLDMYGVITNKSGIDRYLTNNGKKTKVIGCGNGREVGGRPNGWIHVNANGDLFICCNDYDFETVFGNLNEKSLKDIWWSPEHREMVEKSYNTMCRVCASAIWE